jgi:hypothetical protein
MSVIDTEPASAPVRVRRWRALQLVLAAQLVLGVLLGLVWLAWSPHALSYMIDAGNGTGIIVPDESESQVAADGRFVVLTALAGVAFGLLVWRLRPNRGRLTLAVLAVTSVLASLLTRYTGQWLSAGHRTAPLNTAFRPPLTLHATAAVFVQALVAVLIYTMFVGLSGDPELGLPESTAPESTAPEPAAPEPIAPEPAAPGPGEPPAS